MNWKPFLAGMRRFALPGVILWLLVVLASTVAYVRTPPQFVATQTVVITAIAIGQQTGDQQARLDTQATDTARIVTTSDFLTSQKFTNVVSQQFTALDSAHTSVSPQQVGTALTATHASSEVTFSAHASTEREATLLAEAGTQALAQNAPTLLPQVTDATLRFIPNSSPPNVVRDTTADTNARDTLFARIGLATAAALLLVLVLPWFTGRPTSRAVMPVEAS